MSRQQQPQEDNDLEYGWTPEAEEEYDEWCKSQLTPWKPKTEPGENSEIS